MQTVGQGHELPLYRYAFDDAEFDEARGELRVGGLFVEWEHRPLQVLACLLHHVDEVVPREELFDTVWAGERGLLAVSGERSPTVQAVRAMLADVLSPLGRNAEALTLVEHVDPLAYQACTVDPGRAAVLRALKAQILLRLGRVEGRSQTQQALREMQAAGVSQEEIAPYRKSLSKSQLATK